MHRAAADLSTGTTPARGVGPCRACQVGEERAALQPAEGRRLRGDRSAQNRTYGVPGRPVRENLSLTLFFFFFTLPLFFPCEPLDFSPFSRRAQTPFVRYSFSRLPLVRLILPFALLFFLSIPRQRCSGRQSSSSSTLLCACLRHCFWPTRTARVREGGLRVGKGE